MDVRYRRPKQAIKGRPARYRPTRHRPIAHRRRTFPSGLFIAGGLILLAVVMVVFTWLVSRQHVPPPSTVVSITKDVGIRATETPLPSPTSRPPAATPTSAFTIPSAPTPELEALQEFMLDLINADRTVAELEPVQWDALAAQVGQTHAEDMAANGYMSHWNLAGEGPDIRYGRAGGTESVQENVYEFWWRYDDGRPAPITDWEQVVRDAQETLMSSSGHRANILDPAHTHVGIGIAYNAKTGDVRIAQEFLNRYTLLDSLPVQAEVGDTFILSGQLLPDANRPVVNLTYEPFPVPTAVEWFNATSTYVSPAEFFIALEPDMSANRRFTVQVTLDSERRPGIYHIRIWVNVVGKSVQATDAIVEVTR